MDTNPYQPPGDDADVAREPLHGGPAVATVIIDRALMYRAVHFHVLRRRLFERYLFLTSTCLLILLLLLLLIDAPRMFEITFAVLFGMCHVLQVMLPHLYTRSLIQRMQSEAPDLFGEHRIWVDRGRLACSMRPQRWWPLDGLHDVFFLGDMLLIAPEPGVLIPVPQSADFGSDTFYSFCERFAAAARL